ncbi:MAG: glyoxalase/bleomycin resistance/dioxygenase family protein [Anaerolineae bacterium]|nr:glyoxalase/bleomycin resistance/dioxygenase family protein [Gloeobacterales cyanobacterium ES-bin-313]
MKRLHLHIAVDDLAHSVKFYSALFAAEPTVNKSDYAKWMIEEPRVNFAISTRSSKTGLDHLGIQVESPDELQEVYGRLEKAARPVLEEGLTTCCYAKSEKSWIADPQGLSWEVFLTSGESTVYGEDIDHTSISTPSKACCSPKVEATPADAACCAPRVVS